MSAPAPEHPASLSSSGYEDGLGRRSLVFDRAAGITIERLTLRPELGIFERALTARAARLGAFDDDRIARVRGVQRDPDTGALTVDSDFVPGHRLSDLLDALTGGSEDGATAGLDVAVGFLLELLPALGALHTTAGLSHGAVSPGRTVLTARGRIVLLDALYGEALQRLQFAPSRLWSEFGLAVPAGAGPARLDIVSDLSQAGVAALMLALGRPLRRDDFPEGLPTALSEALEIAQIRGSAAFATRLERFLRQLLPLAGRRPFSAARDAVNDLQDFAESELGVANCGAALGTFIREAASAVVAQPVAWTTDAALDEEPEAATPLEPEPEPAPEPIYIRTDAAAIAVPEPEPVAEPFIPTPAGEPAYEAPFVAAPVEDVPAFDTLPEPETAPAVDEAPPVAAFEDAPPVYAEDVTAFAHVTEAPEAEAPEAPAAPAAWMDASETVDPAPAFATAPEQEIETEAAEFETAALAAEEEVTPEPAETSEPVAPHVSARRKRNRGPRAKRDKLRSNAAPPAPLAAPPATPPAAPPPLVAPPPVAAAPVYVEPPPPPRPAAPVRMPFAQAPQTSESPSPYTSERFWEAPAAAPIPLAPPIPVAAPRAITPVVAPVAAPAAPAAPAPLKIKAQPPSGYAPPQPSRSIARVPQSQEPIPYVERRVPARRSSVPWKAAAAAIVVIGVGFAATRGYFTTTDPSGVKAAAKPPSAATVPVAPPKARPAEPGKIEITTTPTGARVLLDGAEAGETPVTLSDVAPGRRVITLVSSAGTVRRTVRVEAGKTLSLDVPVYSGFVNVIAPIVLEVAVGGKSIGTTQQGRMLLPPGRHELTLSNRDLDYIATHMVEIESGEEFRTKVEPRASVNINALPWAEVWVDGKRIGDTPLANVSLLLGTHTVVFKNPQYGEHSITTTIKATSPTELRHDFTKQ